MKRLHLLMALIVVASFSFISTAKRIFVCDEMDKIGLPAASVFNIDGELVSLSDPEGYFDIPGNLRFPLTISYQGYKTMKISGPVDTVAMKAAIIELPDVTINKDRTGVHLICLARESTVCIYGSDTIIFKNKYIVDFILPFNDKDKDFKKQTHARILNQEGGAIKHSKNGSEKLNPRDLFALPIIRSVQLSTKDLKIPETIGMNEICEADIRYANTDMKLRRRGNLLTLSFDGLQDKKGHRYAPGFAKLLGFTMEFSRMESSQSYAYNNREINRALDFKGMSIGFEGLFKGKMIKKLFHTDSDIAFQSSLEIIPLDYQLIDDEESKQIHKSAESYPFP